MSSHCLSPGELHLQSACLVVDACLAQQISAHVENDADVETERVLRGLKGGDEAANEVGNAEVILARKDGIENGLLLFLTQQRSSVGCKISMTTAIATRITRTAVNMSSGKKALSRTAVVKSCDMFNCDCSEDKSVPRAKRAGPEETEVDSGQVTSEIRDKRPNANFGVIRKLKARTQGGEVWHHLYTLNFRCLGSRERSERGPRRRKFKVYKRCRVAQHHNLRSIKETFADFLGEDVGMLSNDICRHQFAFRNYLNEQC
ncbi:hypothetical protein TYRP_020780, partial [Tyrophagus putrescentiae]